MEPGDTLGIVGMRSWFEISNEAIEKWKEHGKKDASVVDEPTGNVEMLPGVVKAEGDVLKAFIPAVRYLHSLIDAELAKGIPSEKIAIVVGSRQLFVCSSLSNPNFRPLTRRR
jgi:hypothetical protein